MFCLNYFVVLCFCFVFCFALCAFARELLCVVEETKDFCDVRPSRGIVM